MSLPISHLTFLYLFLLFALHFTSPARQLRNVAIKQPKQNSACNWLSMPYNNPFCRYVHAPVPQCGMLHCRLIPPPTSIAFAIWIIFPDIYLLREATKSLATTTQLQRNRQINTRERNKWL